MHYYREESHITLKVINQDGVPAVPEAPVILTQGLPSLKNDFFLQPKWRSLYFSYGIFDENHDAAWILSMKAEEYPAKIYDVIIKKDNSTLVYKGSFIKNLRWMMLHWNKPGYEYEAEFEFQDVINLKEPQVLQSHF